MHPVVTKARLSPNVTRLDVVAPRIAQVRQPGQFVIVHLGEGAERIPLTITDSDPKAGTIAALVDPGVPILGPIALRDVGDATAALGQKLLLLDARTAEEMDAQFASLVQEPADAMHVAASPFFVTRAGQIVALAARHRVPAIYTRREFAEAGGLMSYGYDVADGYREMGRYAGRILNGEKPADLPVIQPTKFELVINLKAAKAINFEFPPLIRALADEVIE